MTDTNAQKLTASAEATIPLAPEQVFDYLSTLENNPKWNWSVTATTLLTPGPVGPGSRYLQASTAEPDHPQALEVTRLEPPHLFEVLARGNRLAATYRYELEGGDHNTTRLRVHAEVEPHHPLGLPALYAERLEVSLRASLDTLRGVLTPAGDRSRRQSDHREARQT